ncbi:MAG: type II toxin-antitoxin system Phd/YefM family antitoxin [bacterium]|nr:type II toxin-antitoxin system Phd/YefM family antitoxin [bacterium]
MLTVDERTTIIGVSELRTEVPNILAGLKKNKVVLTKRNKPVGVMVDYEEYTKMERLTEALEDMVLGHLAKERAAKSKKEDYIPLEEMERLVGL